MITREKLIRVENKIFNVISAASELRAGEKDSEEYKLLVDIEAQCHKMTKKISDLTEGQTEEKKGA